MKLKTDKGMTLEIEVGPERDMVEMVYRTGRRGRPAVFRVHKDELLLALLFDGTDL